MAVDVVSEVILQVSGTSPSLILQASCDAAVMHLHRTFPMEAGAWMSFLGGRRVNRLT